MDFEISMEDFAFTQHVIDDNRWVRQLMAELNSQSPALYQTLEEMMRRYVLHACSKHGTEPELLSSPLEVGEAEKASSAFSTLTCWLIAPVYSANEKKFPAIPESAITSVLRECADEDATLKRLDFFNSLNAASDHICWKGILLHVREHQELCLFVAAPLCALAELLITTCQAQRQRGRDLEQDKEKLGRVYGELIEGLGPEIDALG